MDSINMHISERRYFESVKRHVQFKYYLRIKICYKLYREDIDSTLLYFLQCTSDVRFNRHPLKNNEALHLAAL